MLSATLVAVTVTLAGAETCGAVKRPVVEIVPAVACQMTAVLLVEVRVAENCCCCPGRTLTLAGVRLTCTVEPLDGVCALEFTPDGSPAHAAQILAARVSIRVDAILLTDRVEGVLLLKPGDDSKNICLPHRCKFSGTGAWEAPGSI